MNRSTLFYALLGLLLVISGCGSTKKGTKAVKERSAEYIMQQVAQNQIQADWLDARARISYADEDMSVRGTALIRIQRDSLVWMSVRKLGFEVARVQVTKDSVYVIDRINNEYGIFDLGYIQTSYNLPADFQLLQTILMGDAWFPGTVRPTVETSAEAYILSEKSPLRNLTYQVRSNDFRLAAISIEEPAADRSVQLELSEYQPTTDNQLFAYFRTFNITSPETGAISMDMEFSEVTLNQPKSTRFDIPERYTRME